MLKMKTDYEAVIKGLNETIEKYEKALTRSLDMLDQYSNKLEAKSVAELESIRNQSASMIDSTKDIRIHARDVRNRDYSVGSAAADIADDKDAAAFMAAELKRKEEAEANKSFQEKYKKYLAPGLAVAGLIGFTVFNNVQAKKSGIENKNKEA